MRFPDQGPVSFPDELRERFQPVRTLGMGGMGAVFLALDRALDREVAVKVLRHWDNSDAVARLRREAQAMARLRHPHVVQVLDHGETATGPYLVLEYLSGGTLLEPLVEVDLLGACLQVAEGLDAAHELGLIHRDLKPANVLLGEEGRAAIADFGLVRDLRGTAITRAGVTLGTLAFMPPEALRAEAVGPAGDWYAWGVMVFFLVEQQVPFDAEAIQAMATGGEPRPPRFRRLRAGSRLREAVARCLAYRPQDRPRRSADLGLADLGAAGLRDDTGTAPRVEGFSTLAAPAPAVTEARGPEEAAALGRAAPSSPPQPPSSKSEGRREATGRRRAGPSPSPSGPPDRAARRPTSGPGRAAAPEAGASGSLLLRVAIASLVAVGLAVRAGRGPAPAVPVASPAEDLAAEDMARALEDLARRLAALPEVAAAGARRLYRDPGFDPLPAQRALAASLRGALGMVEAAARFPLTPRLANAADAAFLLAREVSPDAAPEVRAVAEALRRLRRRAVRVEYPEALQLPGRKQLPEDRRLSAIDAALGPEAVRWSRRPLVGPGGVEDPARYVRLRNLAGDQVQMAAELTRGTQALATLVSFPEAMLRAPNDLEVAVGRKGVGGLLVVAWNLVPGVAMSVDLRGREETLTFHVYPTEDAVAGRRPDAYLRGAVVELAPEVVPEDVRSLRVGARLVGKIRTQGHYSTLRVVDLQVRPPGGAPGP